MDSLETPHQFFQLVVEENLRDYWDHRDNIRCAFNAAVSCLSMCDWMLASRTSSLDAARRRRRYMSWIRAREPALAEIFDIANCAKHFYLDRGPGKGRSVGYIGWDAFRAGDPVGLMLRPLRILTRDGKTALFEDLLIPAVAYWRRTEKRSQSE
jgi:hypothetical protein